MNEREELAGYQAEDRHALAGTSDPAELTKQLLERARAKRKLLDFAKFIDPGYEPYPVHEHIAEKLEAIEAGTLRRLAIFVPPAIGKSRLASEIFPAWFFGRNPDLEFIETSYDAALAFGFGRAVRNLLKEPRYGLVFPGCALAPDATSMNEWKTKQGGEYKAEGVGGGLIGFHGHIAVIDDPFKNYEAAASLNERRKVWDWYASVLLNRLRSYKNGPGSVILIMQRWHDDDLGGRIEKLTERGEERWDIVSIPSLAEENDPLGREPGQALLPEGPNRRTIEELVTLRQHNPTLFMALHQQKPVPDEGDLFHPGWLRKYTPNDLPAKLTIYGASDWAVSKGAGDFTVHVSFGVDPGGHVWILDIFREQCDMLEGVEWLLKQLEDHKPLKWFMEKVQMTRAIAPVLKKRMGELGLWTVIEPVSIIGRGSKDSDMRAGAIAGAMQMGYVHVPISAPWLGDLEWELSRFPNARYDDQVDTLALIGMQMSKLRGTAFREEVVAGIPVILPVGKTFADHLAYAKSQRSGRGAGRAGGSMVIQPMPPPLLPDLVPIN